MNKPQSLFLLAAVWVGCDRGHGGPTLGSNTPGNDAVDAHARTPALGIRERALDAKAVVDFWRDAGPELWFAKDAAFDRRFRETFASEYEAAARGELDHWSTTAEGALGLIILLDQYPRNSFRGTPRMYGTDLRARQVAAKAIAAGYDALIDAPLRLFVYLPYGHSEDLADQERSVELCRSLGQPSLSRAEHHRDIIRRFGRFPHRNAILGRAARPEEERYLAEGGFKG